MAVKNGMWNVITMKLCPGTMGLRHFIPLVFLLSLVFLPVMSFFIKPICLVLCIEVVLYFLLDIFFSLKISDDVKSFFFLLFLFPAFHITYGFGSIKGITKLLFSKELK